MIFYLIAHFYDKPLTLRRTSWSMNAFTNNNETLDDQRHYVLWYSNNLLSIFLFFEYKIHKDFIGFLSRDYSRNRRNVWYYCVSMFIFRNLYESELTDSLLIFGYLCVLFWIFDHQFTFRLFVSDNADLLEILHIFWIVNNP